MKNNSRKFFHNNDDVDMNVVNVNLLQFENSKINETETKKKQKKNECKNENKNENEKFSRRKCEFVFDKRSFTK